MSEKNVSPVTKDHLTAFGALTHHFAQAEHLMYIAAAGIMNLDLGSAIILMGDTNYSQKRQTLRHLNTTIGVNRQKSTEISEFLTTLHKHSKLRNWIAHSQWVAGKRTGSIKPMQLVLRREEPKPIGHHHNEEDYTAEEIWEKTREIHCAHKSFNRYLKESGLRSRVEAKIAEIRSSTASSPG